MQLDWCRVFLLPLFFLPASVVADWRSDLDRLLQGKNSIGVLALDLASQRSYYRHNADIPFKPASVMKLLTSAVALRELGPEYTFGTEVWARGQQGDRVTILGVKGFGDPSLTLEQTWLLARAIRKEGIRNIDTLILDDSAFIATAERPGQSAYQAQATALALSFNAVAFNVCPRHEMAARIVADPWEAAPKIIGTIKSVSSGSTSFSIDESYRANSRYYSVAGSINRADGCRTVYRSVTNPLSYFGSVFESYLQSLGVTVIQRRRGTMPAGSKLLLKHKSKPLRQIISDLNHYSSNFTAEQILFNLGRREGDQLDRQLGLERIKQYLVNLGFADNGVNLVDASGLSHKNRLSAAVLAAVLVDMATSRALSIDYQASLPVAGRSGTLKGRRFNSNATVRAKSGSLDGVTTLAGYAESVGGKRSVFVILQNNSTNGDELERKIVNLLLQ